jgi:hypothetical protein
MVFYWTFRQAGASLPHVGLDDICQNTRAYFGTHHDIFIV